MAKDQTTPPVDLAAENAALKARVAELEAAAQQASADEVQIAAKMSRGLSRDQAIQVIARQRQFDAEKQAAADKKDADTKAKAKTK